MRATKQNRFSDWWVADVIATDRDDDASASNPQAPWPGSSFLWYRRSITEAPEPQPFPDNATLREWARRSESTPPDSWWESEDDPFEPEAAP